MLDGLKLVNEILFNLTNLPLIFTKRFQILQYLVFKFIEINYAFSQKSKTPILNLNFDYCHYFNFKFQNFLIIMLIDLTKFWLRDLDTLLNKKLIIVLPIQQLKTSQIRD